MILRKLNELESKEKAKEIMANFLDYLQWRGDLTLEQDAFNEVDNLICSYLSYVNLDGIAPGPDGDPKTIRQISEEFFAKYSKKQLDKDKSFVRLSPYLMKAMAESKRFGNALVCNYVNAVEDKAEIQFAALEILLSDGTSYIAYRGTDDHIVGWKEDFKLSVGEVPAEMAAVVYLNYVGGLRNRPLRVGGHSKGGNLSIYGSAKASPEVRAKIIEVYANDGPGFSKEFFKSDAYLEIKSKIQRYVPEASIIGMLLEHDVKPTIIKSDAKNVFQHDGFSWQILGPKFVKGEGMNRVAKVFNQQLHDWIDSLDVESREEFIEDVFSVLEASGADTLTELQNGAWKGVRAMFAKLEEIQPKTKKEAEQFLKNGLAHWRDFRK